MGSIRRDIGLLLLATVGIVTLRSIPARHEHATSELYLWPTLLATTIHTDYTQGIFTADIPKPVQVLNGKPITLGGYMVPIETSDKASHFLLVRRPPTCPFCSPGEPNELVEVTMQSPIAWTDDQVVLHGVFGLEDEQRAGLFFKMTGASRQ